METMTSRPSPQTTASIPSFEAAFHSLKDSVSAKDAAVFQSTTLEEVWQAAEEIQLAQRKRKSLRNVRRIEPFLKCLGKYSEIIGVLCNGTPYLPWIWAPIKLMIQLADEYTNIFDKLADAYSQIAEAMPQFDRLEVSFPDDPNIQAVLGMIYTDILEFHQRAYKFFRRRSWYILFDSLWKSFDFRFQGILKRLSRHQDLLMKEVVTIDVTDARQWRLKAGEEIIRQEKKTADFYLHDSLAWLKMADELMEDELETLSGKRQEGTCEWIFSNPLFHSWKDEGHAEPILWVQGIPGAGKTILSTHVIKRLQEEQRGLTTAYHICNSYVTGKNLLGEILRSITSQLLRSNLELAPYIFENYANKGLAPAIVRLRRLIAELLDMIPSVRIIVDGLDEYPEPDQRAILTELLSLSKSPNGQCRIIFSNRESVQINKILASKPTISLRDQYVDVNKDIEIYVHAKLTDLRLRFEDDSLLDNIEKRIVANSDGMFLWVRLVMQSLNECYSEDELLKAVDTLPKGLDEAYGRILNRVQENLNADTFEKAVHILEWIACSFRILKGHEIQDGIVLCTDGSVLDEHSKLVPGFLDVCKPLIEEGPKGTIDFVHYSAKEYILHQTSGPFLHYHRAHYDLAFSCMNYMNSSLCFSDEEYSEDDLKIRVLKGFHGLHHYANEFWFQHLLQYAKCKDRVEIDELDGPLEDIDQFWNEDPGKGAKSLKLDDTTSADAIKAQLEVLEFKPAAQSMGLDILTFRKFLSQEKYSHQEPKSLKNDELKYDPTFFSQISQRYQRIVHRLIESSGDDLPPGIDPSLLEVFKRIYSDSAFTCRYVECPRYSDGFRTSFDRDEHEKRHTKPLRCSDPTCDFFARGFNSKTGLLKHNRKYHPLPEEVELPEFEPRKEPEPQFVPPAPQLPPPRAATPPAPRATTPPRRSPEPEEDHPTRNLSRRVSRAKKGKLVHVCEDCGKVFKRNEWLKRHRLSHSDPKEICSWEGCGKAFYRNDLLRRHELRHESMAGDSSQVENRGTPVHNSSGPTPLQGTSGEAGPAISVQSLLNSST